MNHFNVVLVEPEIPQNTGCIGRTCVATRSQLHIVGPTGFKITDSNLKRAGLDYWAHLQWHYHENYLSWQTDRQKNPSSSKRIFYFSAKAKTCFFDIQFEANDTFVFGKESKGLDPEILQRNEADCLYIPILDSRVRGLNLATSVAIVLYEAHRQTLLKTL